MKRVARPLAETAMVYALLGWLYVAACAAFRPEDMSAPITALIPMRRDTFGCLCFAASALCAAGLQVGTGRILAPRPRGTGAADAVVRTAAGYCFLVWAYLCVNSLTHPYTIALRLTHFAAVPTEGATAVSCFLLSIAAFLTLRLRGRGLGSEQDEVV
jgi:hypothetical protein